MFTWAPGAAASPDANARELRQIAGILDYVGGDYRGAVAEDGRVLDDAEYQEQRSLAAEADALAGEAGLPQSSTLRRQLAALSQALAERRSPRAVQALCRAARATLVRQHGLVLGPSQPPVRALAERLYREQACATCHGADGGADTEIARTLQPPPADFLDPERVATVSPHRAFYAISFGVAGTAMPAFAHLGERERWSLAFYVLSLRHAERDLELGRRVVERPDTGVPTRAAELAALSEEELLSQLKRRASAGESQQALAYLRARAPFAVPAGAAGRLVAARSALRAGVAAYRAGDIAAARRQLVAAYLDGFEPHEAAIAARDPALVRRIERGMLELRMAAARAAPAGEVERRARDLEALLTRAEGGARDSMAALLGAFTIALREGLEVALLVTALLGLVRRRGRLELVRYVHAGWLLALGAGLITWWGVGELLSGLTRELAEGIAALVAAVVLLGVTHWVFGQLTARRFMGFVAARMGQIGVGRGAAWGVLSLSFIAAYREAFELVLFYKALLLEAGDDQARVWIGMLLGVGALLIAALVLKRIGQRLQPRPFMLMSGVLLALLAFTLAGKGIRALQEAAVLEMTSLALPELPWLGLYATLEGLSVQALVLLLLLASALWPLLNRTRSLEAPAQSSR